MASLLEKEVEEVLSVEGNLPHKVKGIRVI
jgi:hypothetical protein